jgi:hypothetical protein
VCRRPPPRPPAAGSVVPRSVPHCGHPDTRSPHRCPQAVHDRRRMRTECPGVFAGLGHRRWSERSRRSSPKCLVVGRHQRGGSCAGRPCPVWSDGDANSPSTARQRARRRPTARRVACRDRPRRGTARPVRRRANLGSRRPAGPPVPACPRLCWREIRGRGAGSRRVPVPVACARLPVGAPRRCRVVGVPREQAHVPAEHPPPVQDPRLPAADAHPRGPGDHRRSSAQGSREALRLRCCPRRHACAGVRSSPRSSGPVGVPDGRPWCSTTSPNGP